jgi:hypothetical protein
VIWLFLEQIRLEFVPALHGLQGYPAAQGGLRELLVVEPDIAVQRDLQFFPGTEMVALQHVFDATVEALDHAVCLRMHRRGETVLYAQIGAETVKFVTAGCRALAQAEQAVSELLSIVRKHRADAYRAGAIKVAQKAACIGGSLGLVNANEHSSGRAVDGHEEVPPGGFISHSLPGR